MSDLFQFRYTTLPAPVQWGIVNEDRAREEYLSMKNLIESTTVTKTGLTLCSSHSFLGASSDGRVTDSTGEGILEIKCPYSLKGNRNSHIYTLYIYIV